mgnify:CR=1 FL=1
MIDYVVEHEGRSKHQYWQLKFLLAKIYVKKKHLPQFGLINRETLL